jgi:hypothetical protein
VAGAIGALALYALPLLAPAQTASTGTITGRVLNPATNEYVRNAEVRVEGTNVVASTEDGGYYRLHNVPAGSATVVVTFPGAEAATATIAVSAGQTATRDFEVVAAGSRRTGAGDHRFSPSSAPPRRAPPFPGFTEFSGPRYRESQRRIYWDEAPSRRVYRDDWRRY